MKLIFMLVIMAAMPTWASSPKRVEFFNKVMLNSQPTTYVGVLQLDFDSKQIKLVVYKNCEPLTVETVNSDPCLNYLNEVSAFSTPLKIVPGNGVITYSGYRDIITPMGDGTYMTIEFSDYGSEGTVNAARIRGSTTSNTYYYLKN